MNLFTGFHWMNFITSDQLYNGALKLFHIEIQEAQKENSIFVIDENGNPVRYSIKMSDYEERPKFYLSKGKAERIELFDGHSMDKSNHTINNRLGNSRRLVDLLRSIPNYSNENNFRNRKKIIKNRKRGIKW